MTEDPSPEGRYPTTLDAGDADNDGNVDLVIGFGTSCDPNDSATIALRDVIHGGERRLRLPKPYQKLLVRDIDGDGKNEIITSSGGQPGSLNVYRFNPATQGFDTLASSPVTLPTPACTQSSTGITQEPAAFIGVGAPSQTISTAATASTTTATATSTRTASSGSSSFPSVTAGPTISSAPTRKPTSISKSLDMDVCKENVFVDWVKQADYEIAADCDPNYFIGNFTGHIQQGLDQLGISHKDWTSVIAFTNDTTFPASDPNPAAGLTFPSDDGENYVVNYPHVLTGTKTGLPYNIVPEHVFSHEFGHLLGFDEEYVAHGGGLNPDEARLGCDTSNGSCCDIGNEPGKCDFVSGNHTRFGDGRCIMSFLNPDQPPNVPAIHRDWCEDCFHHIKQLLPIKRKLNAPLSCAASYEGNGPLVDFSAKVAASGAMHDVVAKFFDEGRPAMAAPSSGALHLRVENAAGAAIYEARFDAAVRASLVLPGPGPNLPGRCRCGCAYRYRVG